MKFLIPFLLTALTAAAQSPAVQKFPTPTSAEITVGPQIATLHIGDHLANWTLMQIVPFNHSQAAVLEDFTRENGEIIFVTPQGPQLTLPKSSEPTSNDPAKLYLGHTLEQITQSPTDLLAEEILAKPGDPDYETVASVFPTIARKFTTYSFIGSPKTFDKVGVAYGGRTPNFDPAPYYPPIAAIRDKEQVRDGLVGGYLPILRFVYPESDANWTEMLAFAALRKSNDNNRVQPTWYRVARIENHQLKWAQYIDSYHPFPPRTHYDSEIFYRDMLDLHDTWEVILPRSYFAPEIRDLSMSIDIPDARLANMARFGLVREIMTRVPDDFPKYGAVDKDYAGSEHDGFPDTFTVDTAAMLEWGLVDRAGRYIDNYFQKFVRDDGSILYRGPETGQYGRMLTVVAQYLDYGGNPAIALKSRPRIDAVAKLLLHLREVAKKLPTTDPAYGMIAGWSEADASLDPDPPRYMQPYFSNSTEAARGFRDLGRAYETLGRKNKDSELTAWGQTLQRESTELQADIQTSIQRSMLHLDNETILPSIAGVKEPFHIVVPKDPTDPQYRSYRAYMEMLHSGLLTDDQVQTVINYRANHHDTILGMPTAYGYNTGVLVGFLSYGHAYGLIQHDKIREALLLLYSDMAHQYTRGTWTAPETRSIRPTEGIAPYCTPAQLVVTLITKWMLVFEYPGEDPKEENLWLAKSTPRAWLEEGKKIEVKNAPTKWGTISYTITSHMNTNIIEAKIKVPKNFPTKINLRLRTPKEATLKSVTLNGKNITTFDPKSETITIEPTNAPEISLEAHY